MTEVIIIRHRVTSNAIYVHAGGTLRAAVEAAVVEGVSLAWADLRGAVLAGAYLAGADLRHADLRGAVLVGADVSDVLLEGATLGDTSSHDWNKSH